MTPWQIIDAELQARGKNWSWLASRLGDTTQSRVGNWKRRGVPSDEFGKIAVVFNESVDWVMGLSPPRRMDPTKFTPMAIKLASEFDTIPDARRQVDAFAECLAAILRARAP